MIGRPQPYIKGEEVMDIEIYRYIITNRIYDNRKTGKKTPLNAKSD